MNFSFASKIEVLSISPIFSEFCNVDSRFCSISESCTNSVTACEACLPLTFTAVFLYIRYFDSGFGVVLEMNLRTSIEKYTAMTQSYSHMLLVDSLHGKAGNKIFVLSELDILFTHFICCNSLWFVILTRYIRAANTTTFGLFDRPESVNLRLAPFISLLLENCQSFQNVMPKTLRKKMMTSLC